MGKRRIIIDGDSLTFYASKETIEDSIESLEQRLVEIFQQTSATDYIIFLSDGLYFRHKLYPQYKALRNIYKNKTKNYSKVLKHYLIVEHNAKIIRQIEADDAVAYTKTLFPDSIVCSPDKDVLHQISGTHFDYRIRKNIDEETKIETIQKGVWVNTSKVDANHFLWLQTLMGDSTDGIKGIPGVGIKNAEKILAKCKVENYYSCVLNEYIKHYDVTLGIYWFYINFNLIKLLKTEDDFHTLGIPIMSITEDDFNPLSDEIIEEWNNL